MNISRVLVTGGTGFVGYWMRRTGTNYPAMYASKSEYEIGDWDTLAFSHVVHLAPVAPYPVIEYCKKHNARLLYCSSGIVYHPENNTEYRRNKLSWESECLESDVDVVIARLFTFYGERLDEHKAYTQFTKAATQNSAIELWGDGKTVRSYMHGSELGKWMWAILLRGMSGEAYDVGDDEPVTMIELAQAIKKMYKSQSEIIVKGGTDPMPYYLPPNTAKTKALL